MNLEGIINISGKPGLYKVISQGNNTIIVESLIDGKRAPLHSSTQANMLEEIGIYTHDDTKSLSDIFDAIAQKENCKETINHKSSENELRAYFIEILPDYDQDKVYLSDIKKVFQWYNTMQNNDLIKITKKEVSKE
ncbi:DUF5606 domain-containing protein [Flavobacteriales bacterium]|nr:DUF5606 domain-containing protein [Flavobacteriales bacterium]